MKRYLIIGVLLLICGLGFIYYSKFIQNIELPWHGRTILPEGAYIIVTITMFLRYFQTRKKAIQTKYNH
ncbi:hypothetical protein [Anaerosacchariphilus polymeriproducens]|uniref:Uncharacterized protein n=1 Tax=Anaerosacchariphilus polymeriproducens TaxID=1812858 RepID=A0A371AYC4_9FIRM|nr:hypothetical protein [Anaerosacchariphilus polymeriproducens]RDU24561.1 hypothetical protein DWV06_03605 [Anaerosacchariphilus polymeriproducens]